MKPPYTLYKNSSILLSGVDIPQLPEEVIFAGQRLFVKDEFHITLVGARYLAEIVDSDNKGLVVDQIVQEFEGFVKTTPLENYKISNDLRFVETNKEKAIVVMAEVPDIDKLFDHLNQKFAFELPRQQTHVTLYRFPQDFIGIPIPSAEALRTISKRIEIPELQKLL